MEDKKQQSKEEYQFIREKVIAKKKNRIRKACLYTIFTVFLAIIFGIVARLVFIYADAPLKRLLGLEKGNTVTPTAAPEPTKEMTPTAKPTPTPTVTQEAQITEVPTPPELTPEPTITQEPVKEPQQIGIADYQSMYAALRAVASEAESSLVNVTAFVTGTSWLDDPYEIESQTTGVVVEKTEKHLLVLVNLDRIETASQIGLTVNGEFFEAEVWNYEKDYNLALIRVAADALPPRFAENTKAAVLGDSASVEIGTPILALGNPNGYMGSMEQGIVTSKGSVYYITDNSIELFQTDTSNLESGDGVIVNLQGEIIGLITRTLKPEEDASMCTAIGMTKLKSVIQKLIENQKLIYFGITGEDIPLSVLKEDGLSNGIYVTEVKQDSPAFEAGIKMGDILLKVGETNIYSYSGFYTMLNLHKSGESVQVTVMRTVRMTPKQLELTVVLDDKK